MDTGILWNSRFASGWATFPLFKSCTLWVASTWCIFPPMKPCDASPNWKRWWFMNALNWVQDWPHSICQSPGWWVSLLIQFITVRAFFMSTYSLFCSAFWYCKSSCSFVVHVPLINIQLWSGCYSCTIFIETFTILKFLYKRGRF